MPNVSFVEYLNQADPSIQGIVQIITNASVFLRRLRFIQVPMFSYELGRQVTTGGATSRGLNENYTPGVGKTVPGVEILKIHGGTIKTDRQLARGPKGNAFRSNNIAAKAKRVGLNFDRMTIKGDSTKNPRDFDGLNRRLSGKQAINVGGQLVLPALDLALDRTLGTDDQKIIVCNKEFRRQVTKLVIDAAGGAAVADVNKGITQYKGATLEVVDEDGDNEPILDFNEDAAGATPVNTYDATGELQALAPALGAYGSAYVCNPSGDTDMENFRGLVREVDGTMIEQVAYGERSGFFEDLVEAVFGIVLHHPRSATRLYGITSQDYTQETAGAA